MHRPEADLREALALLEAWLADYQDGPQPMSDDPLHVIAQLHADLMRRDADKLRKQLLLKQSA